MRLALLKEIPEQDVNLRGQWNALVERLDHPEVFYTYEWAVAVQRAYKSQLPPLVFLGYEGADLCGVVALTGNNERRDASFLCATTGDYCDFIGPAEIRPEFVAAVLSRLREEGIARIALANLPADSVTHDALRSAAKSCGFHRFTRTAYDCAQIALDRLERMKDGRIRAPGQNRLKKVEKAMGPVGIEHRRSWADVRSVLPEFVRAHVGRFLETGRISILTDPARQTFLEELAKLLSEEEWLLMTRLMIQGRPAAWHYGFGFHNTWFWYQPTFDGRLEKYSPGSCLLSRIIQDAIDDHAITTVDLGLGAEGYKANFSNASRRTLYVDLQKSVFEHWATVVRYQLAKAARSSPSVERFAERSRDVIRRVRARLRESGTFGILVWTARRVFGSIWSDTPVNFYVGDFPHETSAKIPGLQLLPLTLDHLAEAAILYRGDHATTAYLLRAAKRLRVPEAEGYVLTDTAGSPVHFAWIAPFSGFYCAELKSKLESSPEAVMLFDCWTPSAQRGRKYYESAIAQLGALAQAKGKEPWIFGAKSNIPSVRGIERAGFRLQYRLVRKRRFGRQSLIREVPAEIPARALEVAIRV